VLWERLPPCRFIDGAEKHGSYNALVNWGPLIDFLHRWQWLAAVIVAGAPAVYYGPKKALETWDWYVDRFRDRPVLRVLREVRIPKRLAPLEGSGPGEVSPTIVSIAKHGCYSVGDLADILNRSHRSIGKSVSRLRAQGKIELGHGGFKLKG
jgi:hypothetical protein